MKLDELYPSKHLAAADLAGKDCQLIISGVSVERLGEEEKPVIAFQRAKKTFVLNKTNARMIAALYGDDTDDWIGKTITLYPTKVDIQGKIVDAIRVRGEAQSLADNDDMPF